MHAPQVPLIARTEYRADIDGLRAVAVLSVLAYHYSAPFPWPLLPGGFTGVDVFFVISGFLITSKLSDDIRSGTFSILGFYDRRIRRILPALIVMLAVTLLAGKFLLMPGDYKALSGSTAAAAFGVSNFFFLSNTGYFDQASNLMPLLHTWSLAVEEQFYVVWPVLLYGIASAVRRKIDIAALLAGLTIVGFACSLLWFDADPKSAFFMALPRAWELILGALLVFLPMLPRALGAMAVVAGLALIGAGFAFTSAEAFPGSDALYPCIGAALVIWPRREPVTIAHWLGRLAPIGLISYSLYLWHWPVWVLFRIYTNNGLPRIREALALAVVSIVLAVLSYRFVEKPLRKKRLRPSRSVLVGFASCTLMFLGATFAGNSSEPTVNMAQSAYPLRSREVMWNWKCPDKTNLEGRSFCVIGAPWNSASTKGILWGDSHAQHLEPIIDTIARERGISFIVQDTCPAAFGGHIHRRWLEAPDYKDTCVKRRNQVLNILASNKIRYVVLAGAWTTLSTVDLYADDGRAGDRATLIGSGLRDILPLLSSSGRKTIVVADMTGPGTMMVDCVVATETKATTTAQCPDAAFHISRQEREFVLRSMADRLGSLASPDVTVIQPLEAMCKESECLTRINGEFLWMDYSHIRRNLLPETDRELAYILGFDAMLR